jgi:hypothetical protein
LSAPRPEPAEPGFIETFFNKEIALRAHSDVQAFLKVLDDFIKPLPATFGRTDRVGARQFRLWLRGKDMKFGQSAEAFCQQLTRGAIRWCTEKAHLYQGCDLTIQTRLAIFDFYWLMKLFGTEVSTSGIVTHKYPAWFDDICSGAANADETKALIEAQKIFLQATSLACNWMQGTPLEPTTPEPGQAWVWNQVFCGELHEIAHYRRERPEEPEEAKPEDQNPAGAPGQSQGNPTSGLNILPNLVGLAFSGGGIRSATFNLGVLEALKDLDLLRRIDYLSTVSGGGYIGAWLVGNVRRRPAWLGKAADWRESIRYLRRYANYLAPKVGLLSADTWNMWAIWSRNTILVQLLLFLSIAVALMFPYVAGRVFQHWASAGVPPEGGLRALVLGCIPLLLLTFSVVWTVSNLCNLKTQWKILPFSQGLTQWLIVVPLLGAALLGVSHLLHGLLSLL